MIFLKLEHEVTELGQLQYSAGGAYSGMLEILTTAEYEEVHQTSCRNTDTSAYNIR
jgi:hypothetical protein